MRREAASGFRTVIDESHPERARRLPRGSVSIAAIIWVTIFAVYNLNGREIPSGDSQAAKFAAVNLAKRHALTLDGIVGRQQLYAERLAFVRDRAGHFRNAYPLPPVLEAAGVASILQLLRLLPLDAPLAPRIVGKLTASAFLGLAAALAFLTAVPYCGTSLAAMLAIGFGLGTGLWPVASQTLWQHEAAIWSLMAAICLWVLDVPRRPVLRAAAIGVLLGWSVSARPQTGPLVAIIALGVMWSATRGQRVATLSSLVAVAGTFVALNVFWFGHAEGPIPQFSALNMSIHGTITTWQWPGPGAAGLLFSPSRGLLIFSPIVLVIVAARRTGPRGGIVAWTQAAAAVQFVVYSSYAVWWGGYSYGPRYLLDLLPALVPAAAAGLERLSHARAPVRAIAGLALVWSIVASATGAFCYPNDEWNTDPLNVDQAHGRLWDVRDSQIVRCWRRGLSPQNFAMFDRAAWRPRADD
ncbi:MAG TPA: hypothetical protein VNC21_02610 [Vicinamibacterales bacterium]|nr:hypothetical protein [Vicinamibacterales bacterium]